MPHQSATTRRKASLRRKTFIVQLDPGMLLLLDDTDATVKTTLSMAADTKAGFYSNGASPSRQATNYQSGVLFPDAGAGNPLSEMTSSAVGKTRPDATVIAAEDREEECTTAAAAAFRPGFPAIRRADTESRGYQTIPPLQLAHLRASSKKARLVLIMFTFQAALYIFFAITLSGVGADFLSGIPAIISVIGSFIAVITVLMNFGVQVREGRGSEGT